MELFAKKVKGFQLITLFPESSILDVWLGLSDNVSFTYPCMQIDDPDLPAEWRVEAM